MALRLALSYSDRAIEAYDVLVALLESEIALSTERNSLTIDNRRAAENVAYHMLNRLENDCANVMGTPWEDSIILSDEYVYQIVGSLRISELDHLIIFIDLK